MVPNMYEKMPWDPVRDFAPVSLVGTIEWGLIAAPNAPFKSAGDLIAAAKANPGKINYASGGNGSPQHIAMALFASSAGIDLVHVPYKGATQAALDVAAGQVPVGFQGLGTVASLVRGNKLRLIGVSAQSRNAQFPDVPTINESGLPNFFFNSWFTVMAPAGTPPEIVTRLNLEIRKALESKDVQEKLVAQGFAVFGSSPEELSRAMVMQLEKYRVLMKAAGIKAD
jgi:tripartite-type tricarboxylate transporter receptor subunit TctC